MGVVIGIIGYLMMTLICAVGITAFMLLTYEIDADEIFEAENMVFTLIASLFWFILLPLLILAGIYCWIITIIRRKLEQLEDERGN